LKNLHFKLFYVSAAFYATGFLLDKIHLKWFAFNAFGIALLLVAAVFLIGNLFVERLSRTMPEGKFYFQLANQVLRMILLIAGLTAILVFNQYPKPIHLAAWFMFFYVVFAMVDIQSILDNLRPDLKS